MFESNKPTRIGDILMERGLISRPQLLQALDLQQARHLLRGADAPEGWHNEIGEILIELGFITRDQLKKNLARQSRMRKTTLAFTLVAPLFTMACGGGGGANASTPVAPVSNAVSSSVVIQPSSSKQPESAQSSPLSKSSAPPQSPASKSSSSSPKQQTPSSVSSTPTSSTKSSAKSSAVAKTSGASSSVSVQGPVVLYWAVPSRRENGAVLDINEISGYQVRYKLRNKVDFTYVNIPSGFTDTYYFDYLKGDYEFQIAAIDVNGTYSRFVPINPAH
ncbi:hypothetical protein [Cellvibrio mixtus]|uniref:hypothetical protein n=1 Tax=Cellvibrio mixtus TaxID=39650 RepID=UPI000587475C|nr:hypothetical protein [Cellvibrio mixtus]